MSDKEIVGRRIFGEISRYYVKSQSSSSFRFELFVEDRVNEDLSVDRLGIREPEDAVVEELTPDCRRCAAHQKLSFSGWAGVAVKLIRGRPSELDVIPTPEEHNRFHASVLTNGLNPQQRNLAAFFMAKSATLIPLEPTHKGSAWRFREGIARVWQWILAYVRRT